MRFCTLIFAVFVLSGCGDSTAPNPQGAIRLSPFSNQVVYMEAWPNHYWANVMTFSAPRGVDPILTKLTFTPIGTEDPGLQTDIDGPPGKPAQACENECSETVWEYYVSFRAGKVGEAMAKVCVESNPSECSSFKIIVRPQPEKG